MEATLNVDKALFPLLRWVSIVDITGNVTQLLDYMQSAASRMPSSSMASVGSGRGKAVATPSPSFMAMGEREERQKVRRRQMRGHEKNGLVSWLKALAGQCGATGINGHFFSKLSASAAKVKLRSLEQERVLYSLLGSVSEGTERSWTGDVIDAVDSAVTAGLRRMFLRDKFVVFRLGEAGAAVLERAVIAATAITSVTPGSKWITKDHRAHTKVVDTLAAGFRRIGVKVLRALFGEAVEHCEFAGTHPQLVVAFDKADADQTLHMDANWAGIVLHFIGTPMAAGEATDLRAWRDVVGVVGSALEPSLELYPGDIIVAATDIIHRGMAACPYSTRVFQTMSACMSSASAGAGKSVRASRRGVMGWNINTSLLGDELRERWEADGFRLAHATGALWVEEGSGKDVKVSIMNGDDAGALEVI